MDMTVEGPSLLGRVFSAKGRTAISHYFVMDWASLGLDIVIGLALAGVVAVVVPSQAWSALFVTRDPVAARFVGPLVGPLVAVFTFVCSIGNVPSRRCSGARGAASAESSRSSSQTCSCCRSSTSTASITGGR